MFQLNLGIRAHDMNENSFDIVAKKIKENGLNHTQLAPFKQFGKALKDDNSLSPGFANLIRHQLEEAKVDIGVLGCYVNIVHLDPKIQAAELKKFDTCLRLARNFGATLVGTETGSVGNGYTEENYTEASFERMVEAVLKMVSSAEKWGITVGIEPGVNHPLHTIEKAERLLARVPSNNLQLILDPVNLLNMENYQNQTEITEDAIQRLGDRVVVFHLKDYIIKDGKIVFVPIGQGNMDIKPMLRYAKYERPNIQISLEDTKEDNLVDSLMYIEQEYNKI